MRSYWGIDLGGTKIEGVVLPTSTSTEPLCRMRVPTESDQGYEHILSQIGKLIQKMKTETGIEPEHIGIGTPGTLDPVGSVLKNSNTVCLIGKPFKADLEKSLGLKVSMANDANCFALAETLLGAGQSLENPPEVVFGIIMGTGVGAGVVVNQRIINGQHGVAGEWGHNFLDESGGPCYCGRTGCVETLISGPALARYYQKKGGDSLSLKEIYRNFQQGNDPIAKDTMDQLIRMFGRALGPIVNVLDPNAIILGGGVGNIDLLYDRGREETSKYVFNPSFDTPFLKPVLGDSAGVFGAAMLTATP